MTPKNRAKIDKVIHQYVGEHSEYERCSTGWKAEGKKVKMDVNEKKKLIEAVKAATK